jgi:drug/metabolite transporter (DMT)-like permease
MAILNPIFGVIFAMLILGEQLSLMTALGAAVALTGIAIVTLRKAHKIEIPVEGP